MQTNKPFQLLFESNWYQKGDLIYSHPKILIKRVFFNLIGIYTLDTVKIIDFPFRRNDHFVYNVKIVNSKFYIFGICYKTIQYNEDR